MNQPKNCRKNKEADTPKTMSESDPFSSVLKSGEADKLGATSSGKVLYEIAQNSEVNNYIFEFPDKVVELDCIQNSGFFSVGY